jgi:2'-5' RNA ligase
VSGWRCFVAVPIGDDLRARLRRAVEVWRAQPEAADLRWTDADGWHVTLAFLGSTDPEAVESASRALADAVRGLRRFSVPAGGLGTFPGRSAARVLWYGLADDAGRLGDLAGRVRSAVGTADDDGERFRAHLTLARAQNGRGTRLPAGWPQSPPPPDGELSVDRVVLFRSHLGRGPAHYEALATVRMEGAA